MLDESQFTEFALAVRADYASASLDELAADRAGLTERIDQLGGYGHRSRPQDDELDAALARRTVLDELIGERHTAARRSRLAEIRRAAADPGNRESGDGSGVPSAPSHARRGRGRRDGDAIYRTRAPWEDADWSGSQVQRAYDCLEAFRDDQVSRAGRERLADLLGEDSDEQTQASRLVTAVSHPAYRSAFAKAMRGGMQYWSDDERRAAGRVGELIGRAGTIATGSLGMALPLDMDPAIRLVNGGSANPWRELSSVSATTSNFRRFITSTGATAAWTGEGLAATDGTPTLTNVDVTPIKAMSWIVASYESIGWTQGGTDGDIEFASQVAGLLADAKDALEVAAFTTGTGGTGSPMGLMTAMATASDLTLGTGSSLTFASISAVKEAVPPRFRVGAGSRTAWLCTIQQADRLLQVPSFTGSLTTLVDSSGPRPRMLGADIYECSAMATGSATGVRSLLYGDFSQNLVVDRWPGFTLFENLVHDSSGLPTGQGGYLYVWRVGMAQSTTAAWRVGVN